MNVLSLINQLVTYVTSTISSAPNSVAWSLVNHHVPIMHGIVTERPHSPWLNHDLDEMKRQVRLREREPTTTVFVTAAGFNKGCVLQS